jgi:hypothetical protein
LNSEKDVILLQIAFTISVSRISAMAVKKVMPKGGRKSSPTLWAMVRGLTDDEWRQMKAFANVYGKGSLQFKLLELLRSMEVYDPVAEKAALEGHALYSMRNTARYWLIRTACRLAFYQTEVAERVLDVDVLLRWGYHEFTLEYIEETKQTAKEQEEYAWLDMLYHQEIAVIKLLYQGEERSHLVQAIAQKAVENARILVLKAEIEEMVARHLEHGRNKLLASGNYDAESARDYFKSRFCRQKIVDWPLSFQIQKLRIDEALHYFSGNVVDAAKIAERILLLTQKLEHIRLRQSEDQSRIMFRLSAYYTVLGDRKKLMGIIEGFRELLAAPSAFRMNYLRRAINTLLNTAFEYEIPALAIEAVTIWNENQDELQAMPKDIMGLRALYLLCSYYLGTGKVREAKTLYGKVVDFPKIATDLPMQVVLKFMHLMLLLDEADERGLESFGKNYKRHLKALLPSKVAEAALTIVTILCKTSNLEGGAKLRDTMQLFLKELHSLQQSSETTFNPFIYPMIMWANLRLQP